jgi:hypothetical protein
MNPGIVEEGGTTARSLIEAVKHQPALLALIVFNVVFIVLIYLGLTEQRNRQHEILKQLISNAEKAQEMLFKCVVPQRPAPLLDKASKQLNDEGSHKPLGDTP